MSKRTGEAFAESGRRAKMESDLQLADDPWNLISDFFPDLPPNPNGGRPAAPARDCLEGVLWILRNGARWSDLPKRYPSGSTCWRRRKKWTESGIWDQVQGRLLRKWDRQGQINHEESIADVMFSAAKKGGTRWQDPMRQGNGDQVAHRQFQLLGKLCTNLKRKSVNACDRPVNGCNAAASCTVVAWLRHRSKSVFTLYAAVSPTDAKNPRQSLWLIVANAFPIARMSALAERFAANRK